MEKLLGRHSEKKRFGMWLNCIDHNTKGNHHRELFEKENTRKNANRDDI